MQLVLSRSDYTLGEVLTAEMNYDPKDPNTRAKLMDAALKGKDYDFVFMPKYELTTSAFSTKIKLTGRGAKVR